MTFFYCETMSENRLTEQEMTGLRVPPHSLESEQSVVGGLLLDNQAWDKIGDVIRADDFYRYDHRVIFEHIAKLIDGSKPADVITVYESLQSSGKAEDVGGLAYLNTLATNTPSAANIRRYAEIVRDRAVLRRLITISDDIATTALNPQGKDTKTILDEAESKIFKIAEDGARGAGGFQDLQPVLSKVVERIDELYHRDSTSDITGISTGFVDLDGKTSGLQPGDLIIVAGRPSMGKAQPLDALIKTPNGWAAMGELRVGDSLASQDGDTSVVTGVFPQGEKQIYKVAFSDGRSAECCDEHLWRVMYRDWSEPRVISTKRLIEMLGCVRYKNRLWIDTVTGDFGHNDTLPVDPWVLGAMLGDGTLAFSHSSVMFSTKSEELVHRMNALLGHDMELVHAQAYDYRVVWKGRMLANGARASQPNYFRHALNDMGVLGCVSHNKFIPEHYLRANKAARLALLQGLLDTDGWIESWGSIRFATASEKLANDVAYLARSLGGFCSIATKNTHYTSKGERKEGRLAYVLNMSFASGQQVFTLEEKKARMRTDWKRRRRLTFQSIDPVRLAQAQCISVSHPSRTYITNDFVVTHNTAFSLNIGEHVAVEEGHAVAVFSMEMGATQLAMRLLGSVGRLDQHRLRTGRLTDEDWPRLTYAVEKMQNAQLFIDETPALSSMEVRARCRRLARQCGQLGLVIIDYLQLMGSSSPGENRATEISEISRSLKGLAKELNCPVIALSQLNRSLEQRPNKRPVMSDLRESGAIEQDADVILFIYRDEVYNPDSPDKGTAEIIIGKQRNGPIGTVRVTFLGMYTKFENYAGMQPEGD